ncbi:hypothetical protein D3C72_2109890 [compost metagenome]
MRKMNPNRMEFQINSAALYAKLGSKNEALAILEKLRRQSSDSGILSLIADIESKTPDELRSIEIVVGEI